MTMFEKKNHLPHQQLASLFLALALITGCAKKLPEKVSEDIKENVYSLNLFQDPSMNLVVQDEDEEGLENLESGIEALSDGQLKAVIFNGPSEVAKLFVGLKLQGLTPGLKYPVLFKFTRSYLVAYIEAPQSQLELLSRGSISLKAEGKNLIPIFQYSVESYGILRRAKNDLDEDTRNVEYVVKNVDQADHVKINSLTSNRQLAGAYGQSATERSKLLLRKSLKRRAWSASSLLATLNLTDEQARSLKDTQLYYSEVVGSNLYFFTVTDRSTLGHIEANFAKKDPLYLKCSPNDLLVTGLKDEECVLRPLLFLPLQNISTMAVYDDNRPTAQVNYVHDANNQTSTIVSVDLKTTALSFDPTKGISDDLLDNVYALSIFQDSSISLRVDGNKEDDSSDSNVDIQAMSEKDLKPVVYSGPQKLANLFSDLKLQGLNTNEQYPVVFKFTKSYLVAYIEAPKSQREHLGQVSSSVEDEGKVLVPIFQYPVDAYGTLRRVTNELDEETRNVEFLVKNLEQADYVKISSLLTRRQLAGAYGQSVLERSKLLLRANLKRKVWSAQELMFKLNLTNEQVLALKDNQKYYTEIVGQNVYLLTATDLSTLDPLEATLARKDPRYQKCSPEDLLLTKLSEDKCILKPVMYLPLQNITLRPVYDDNRPTAGIEYVDDPNNHFSPIVRVDLADSVISFEPTKGINGLDETYLAVKDSFDLEAEYIYVPSTLGTPREVSDADPFFQGDEKIVKLKFTKLGLGAFEIEKDPRFADNDLNDSPVFFIPGTYIDLRCQQDQFGNCTAGIRMDTSLPWNKRGYFVPDFDALKKVEINSLDLFATAGHCLQEKGAEVTSKSLSKDHINLEMQRTFQYNDDISCIIDLFYSNNLKSASFNVKYFYSLVKLDTLVDPKYQAITYPVQDQLVFGFFKDENHYLDGQFDSQRPKEVTYLSRFSTNQKDVPYYLSETFQKPKNKAFKEATIKAIETINQSLSKADAKIQIKLLASEEDSKGRSPGDLRNNMIVLIDEPLANGLLGYAPTVTNPKTGQILQGHVNMYSGTIYSMTRRVYENMVDLSYDQLNVTIPSNSELVSLPLDLFTPMQDSKDSSTPAPLVASDDQTPAAVEALRSFDVKRLSNQLLKKRIALKKDPEAREALIKEKQISSYEAFLDRCAENNAFHEEFFTVGSLGKDFFKGVKEVDGVLNANKTLKRWKDLTDKQREELAAVIAPAVYSAVLVHEFGHNLGLRHNFMGSFDKDNYYTHEEAQELGLKGSPAYSSVMDYAFSELNELSVFGKYDLAALRFAYAREVETKEGKFLKVENTLNETLAQNKEVKLKDYFYCTDENAGLSSICNRFDEGHNLVEITKHMIKRYVDGYKYRNFRDQRPEFSQYGIYSYVAARFGDFKRIRNVLEEFESLTKFIGAEDIMVGCSEAQTAKNPDTCNFVNDRRDAVKLATNFFFEILKTPELSCALASKEEPTKVAEVRLLKDIFEKVKRDEDLDHVPTNCFEPVVKKFLEGENLVVLAQAGAYHDDIRSVDSRYVYKSDIDVRGIWPDKLLAMRALMTRSSLTSSTEDSRFSLVDLEYGTEKMANFFSHIVLGEKLEGTSAFVTEDGKKLEAPYKLDLSYVIPEVPYPQFLPIFYLPKEGRSYLNEELLEVAFKNGLTNDVQFRDRSKQNANFLSVIKRPSFVELAGNIVTKVDGADTYAAYPQNVLAYEIITKAQSFEILKASKAEVILEVFKMRQTPPSDLTSAQLVAWSLPVGLVEQMINLANDEVELTYEMLVGQVGDVMAKKILEAYTLKAQGLRDVLLLKEKVLTVAPEDATQEVKNLYKVAMGFLQKFLADPDMQAEVEYGLKNLALLPVQ